MKHNEEWEYTFDCFPKQISEAYLEARAVYPPSETHKVHKTEEKIHASRVSTSYDPRPRVVESKTDHELIQEGVVLIPESLLEQELQMVDVLPVSAVCALVMEYCQSKVVTTCHRLWTAMPQTIQASWNLSRTEKSYQATLGLLTKLETNIGLALPVQFRQFCLATEGQLHVTLPPCPPCWERVKLSDLTSEELEARNKTKHPRRVTVLSLSEILAELASPKLILQTCARPAAGCAPDAAQNFSTDYFAELRAIMKRFYKRSLCLPLFQLPWVSHSYGRPRFPLALGLFDLISGKVYAMTDLSDDNWGCWQSSHLKLLSSSLPDLLSQSVGLETQPPTPDLSCVPRWQDSESGHASWEGIHTRCLLGLQVSPSS